MSAREGTGVLLALFQRDGGPSMALTGGLVCVVCSRLCFDAGDDGGVERGSGVRLLSRPGDGQHVAARGEARERAALQMMGRTELKELGVPEKAREVHLRQVGKSSEAKGFVASAKQREAASSDYMRDAERMLSVEPLVEKALQRGWRQEG